MFAVLSQFKRFRPTKIKVCEQPPYLQLTMSPSSTTSFHYDHKENDKYFSDAFSTFSELRKNNIMTDIVLTTSNDQQRQILNGEGFLSTEMAYNEKTEQSLVRNYLDAILNLF